MPAWIRCRTPSGHEYHRHPERVVLDAEEPQQTGRDTYEQGGPAGSYHDQRCQLMREYRSRVVDVGSLGGRVRLAEFIGYRSFAVGMSVEGEGCVDQCEMGEPLREVAQKLA